MTREEAIEVLKEYRTIVMYHLEAETPAFDMAIEALSAEQVTGKLKNPCDSLLTDDSAECKEQKSKLEPSKVDFRIDESANIGTEVNDLISRADALEQMAQAECGLHYDDCEADNCSCSYIQRILDIPSADAVSREFYEDAVKANIGLVIENRKLKEQLVSADAVQVVRCKDCGNFDYDFNYCNFLEAGVEGEDFFCAYGERKEND